MLPLPNLTERMKNALQTLNLSGDWTFRLERILITDSHRELAQRMVTLLTSPINANTTQRKVSLISALNSAMNLKRALTSGSSKDNEDMVEASSTRNRQSLVRLQALQCLREQLKSSEDAPPSSNTILHQTGEGSTSSSRVGTSINTTRNSRISTAMSTKRASLQNTRVFDTHVPKLSNRPRGQIHDDISELTGSLDARGTLQPHVQDNQSDMHSLSQEKTALSNYSSASLWSTAEQLCEASKLNTHTVVPAFSDSSLNLSRMEGFINSEEYDILKEVANNPDRLMAFDRSVPALLLRNPKLSLHSDLDIKSIDRVNSAEVNFGEQKVSLIEAHEVAFTFPYFIDLMSLLLKEFYANADKYLDEKDKLRLSKLPMVHSFLMARIERSVRRVRHMVHVLPPPTHDDVMLPGVSTIQK
jgi:hypothetical protein